MKESDISGQSIVDVYVIGGGIGGREAYTGKFFLIT